MFNQRIPLISSTSGLLDDGVFLGQVNQSPLVAVLHDVQMESTVYVIRKDKTGANYSFVDITVDATSDVADSFSVFGSDASFTTEDTVYVAGYNSTNQLRSLYFDIDTPGVWTGTGLEVWDSTDGVTANRQRTIIIDESDGLRNTDGIYKIELEEVAEDSVEFTPVPGDIESRPWYVVKLAGATATTTAPLCRRMWFQHLHKVDATEIWTDMTSMFNKALDNAVFDAETLSVFPVERDNEIIVFDDVTYGMDLTSHRALTADLGIVTEYFASDNTWKTLSTTDTSDGYQNGPAALVNPTEDFTVRWVAPTDWVAKSRIYNIDGISTTVTGYYMRNTVTSIVTHGPVEFPLTRGRSRSFGDANTEGVQAYSAITFKGASISGIGTITADTTIQIVNMTTGDSREIEIPAAATVPLNIDFEDMTVSASQKFGMSWVSGGTLTDVQINILE